MALRTLNINSVLGYTVAVVTLLMGVAVLSGLLVAETAPARLRYTFGTVLLLWSAYRFVLTWSKTIRRREGRDEE